MGRHVIIFALGSKKLLLKEISSRQLNMRLCFILLRIQIIIACFCWKFFDEKFRSFIIIQFLPYIFDIKRVAKKRRNNYNEIHVMEKNSFLWLNGLACLLNGLEAASFLAIFWKKNICRDKDSCFFVVICNVLSISY